MFWSIFVQSLGLILAILVFGSLIAAGLNSRNKRD